VVTGFVVKTDENEATGGISKIVDGIVMLSYWVY
jgi:hypothetical protein